MSIVTKTGDKGYTAVFKGKTVRKDSPQVETYGSLDEASSYIGFAQSAIKSQKAKLSLTKIQKCLYLIMAYLSGGELNHREVSISLIDIEKSIFDLEKTLPTIHHFIIPSGTEASSRLHIARCQVRKSERRIVSYFFSKNKKTQNDILILKYLNRLSDLLFLLSRKYNKNEIKARANSS